MEKLNKLQIKSERIIKNVDLLLLKGGNGDGTCYYCQNCNHEELGTFYGCCMSQYDAVSTCQKYYPLTCYAQEGSCN